MPNVLGEGKDISKLVVAAILIMAVLFGSIMYYLSAVMTPIADTSLSSTPTGAQYAPTGASATVFTLTSTTAQTLSAGSVLCGPTVQSTNAVKVGMANGPAGPFTPENVTVVIGVNNTVTWSNTDPKGIPHTVTSNDGLFNSGDLTGTNTFTCVFSVPGTYYYHCLYHPLMVGAVFVKSR